MDSQTPQQPSSNRTKLLIVTLAIITGLLVLFSLPKKENPSLSDTTQNQTPTPTSEPLAQTTLALTPNPVVTASSSATVNVVVDTGDSGKNNITAVQLELSFDPKYITGISMTPGTFFQNPITMLNQVNIKDGKATFAMGIAPTGNPPSGTGVVAVLNLRLNPTASRTPIELSLLPSSLATGEGISQSVLRSTAGTTIQFSP